MDKYVGSQDPEIWVTNYLLDVQVANGDDWHAENHFPPYAEGISPGLVEYLSFPVDLLLGQLAN